MVAPFLYKLFLSAHSVRFLCHCPLQVLVVDGSDGAISPATQAKDAVPPEDDLADGDDDVLRGAVPDAFAAEDAGRAHRPVLGAHCGAQGLAVIDQAKEALHGAVPQDDPFPGDDLRDDFVDVFLRLAHEFADPFRRSVSAEIWGHLKEGLMPEDPASLGNRSAQARGRTA